jgi:hypothetical protein
MELPRTITILNRSGCRHDSQQKSYGIDQNVAFTALNFFASVVAFCASQCRRFKALTIQTDGSGMFISANISLRACIT